MIAKVSLFDREPVDKSKSKAKTLFLIVSERYNLLPFSSIENPFAKYKFSRTSSGFERVPSSERGSLYKAPSGMALFNDLYNLSSF